MRTYPCTTCENPLFFDNSQCLACGSELAFCPACGQLVALVSEGEGYRCGNAQCGAALAKCANYVQYEICNHAVLADSDNPLCRACRFTATIPDLTVAGNLQKWYRLESAKRRLLYQLDRLQLPYGTAADGFEPPLSFDFKADVIPQTSVWRNMAKEERVYTGHSKGRITINIREADDLEREKMRLDMGEAQRTLVGHFRHEIGHYYWDLLVKGRREDDFIARFGDHNQPTYAEALDRYYKDGPLEDWNTRFVSAYASMHPWEDFAETWATYLDMQSALETASQQGFGPVFAPDGDDFNVMVASYQQLGVALNEINRSMGLIDVVPEILVAPVIEKMRFIHGLVQQAGGSAAEPVTASPDSAQNAATADQASNGPPAAAPAPAAS